MDVLKRLFELQDAEYKSFHQKLIPGVSPERVIGVRTPALRSLAKEIYKSNAAENFVDSLPHRYYEEDNLHGFLVEQITDFERLICELDRFLPFVDNWATCDMLRPKILKKHKKELVFHIERWLSSDFTYVKRFGMEMLMVHFLDEDYNDKYPEMVLKALDEEYYIKMMVAWYFATALSKQYSSVVNLMEMGIPDKWTHNKAIQKAIESRRITPEQKKYLRTLKNMD